jgi:hypothetical protein
MAEITISRFVIPSSELPPINQNGKHHLRFRIITQDRNSISAWSPVYKLKNDSQVPSLNPDLVFNPQASYSYLTRSVVVTIPAPEDSNDDFQRFLREYDVFTDYGDGYVYHGRLSGNSFSIPREDYSQVKIWCQVSTYPLFSYTTQKREEPIINETFKIFETDFIDMTSEGVDLTDINNSIESLNDSINKNESLIFALT